MVKYLVRKGMEGEQSRGESLGVCEGGEEGRGRKEGEESDWE